jgi:hypothetical protein
VFDKPKEEMSLDGVIKVYGERKVLEWLESRPYGENPDDYQWVIYCAKWEVAMYGEIKYDKERIDRKIVSISR